MLAETLIEGTGNPSDASCPLPLPEYLTGYGLAHCLVAAAPLIERARERVRRGATDLAGSYPDAPFDPASIEQSLAGHLPVPLLQMMGRVMVLELNVARLEGVLAGETSEERFASFVDRLRKPEIELKPGFYTCQVNVIDDAAGAFLFPRLALLVRGPQGAPALKRAAEGALSPAAQQRQH